MIFPDGVMGTVLDELHGARELVGGEVLAAVRHELLAGRRGARPEDDVGLRQLTLHLVGALR